MHIPSSDCGLHNLTSLPWLLHLSQSQLPVPSLTNGKQTAFVSFHGDWRWARLQVGALSVFTESEFWVGCKSVSIFREWRWGKLQVNVLSIFTESGGGVDCNLQVSVLLVFTKSGFGVGCKSVFCRFSQRVEVG